MTAGFEIDRCEGCGFPGEEFTLVQNMWLCPNCTTREPDNQKVQPEEPEQEWSYSSLPSGSTTRGSEVSSTSGCIAVQPEPYGTSGCTGDMKRVADDFAAAWIAHHERRPELPMPYAASFCAKRCGWLSGDTPDKGRASRAINALVREGMLEFAGTLKPRGLPNGTKLYRPGVIA